MSDHVSCPFDPVHVVAKHKLLTHIGRCKKNLPPNHDFVQCRFWDLHWVKKDKIHEHYETCSFAAEKLSELSQGFSEPAKFKAPKLIYNDAVPACHSEESWDDIPNSNPVFKPEALMAQAPYMIASQGLSKAKRKDHREQERKRIRELEDTQKAAFSEASDWDMPSSSGASATSGPRNAVSYPVASYEECTNYLGPSHSKKISNIYNRPGFSSDVANTSRVRKESGPSNLSTATESIGLCPNLPHPSSSKLDAKTGQRSESSQSNWSSSRRPTNSYRFSSDEFPPL